MTFPRRAITKEQPYRINFVCLGNICRSPTAEGVFQHLVTEDELDEYFEIDSAGTGSWHVGNPANSKSQEVANQHGVKLFSRARQAVPSDLEYFDLVVAMDHSNAADLQTMVVKPEQDDKIVLLRDFDPDPDDGAVPDPYYGGMDGFKKVFDIVYRSCRALLDDLKKDIK
ncbi:MAG: low molecular weight phosphotyrosine protein phosphatase [Bacteroidetes bacterium]|nr:low molecular weight phosphotyrosine protein phosphatase [Bacteroidota bacterium]